MPIRPLCSVMIAGALLACASCARVDRPLSHVADVPLIPRELLFGNPEYLNPQISPDGERIGYIAPFQGVLNIWIMNADGSKPRVLTHDTQRGIHGFRFAYDNRTVLFSRDSNGDENWRLYGIDLQGGEPRDFTPFTNVRARVLGLDSMRPERALVEMNKRDARFFDLYLLDLVSGNLTFVEENGGDTADWIVDPELNVVGATRPTADGGITLAQKDIEKGEWNEVLRWSPEDAGASEPVAATLGGERWILRDSRQAPATRIVAFDPDTGDTEVLAEDPKYEAWSVLLHPRTRTAQAVSIVRARRGWEVLDSDLERDFDTLLNPALGELSIISRDQADAHWIISYTADTAPTRYYLYRRAERALQHLFDAHPALRDYTLAPMQPIAFAARDGLEIHGYLTLPIHRSPTQLPMVVQVHGGPWSRYVWGYDVGAQWLANRGYAVLSVNFRGSTGYGKDFMNAGDREWGGAMHDDIVDAVLWAIDEGYADPERVAISGGSYGGYAALVGVTFTPDVFACAVVVAGPTNLVTLLESVPPYWALYRYMLYRRLGDPAVDAAFLRSRSPLFKADQIRAPVLLAYGANDPRVKQSEADQIIAALEANGVDYEYLLFPDEGHGFVKPENRLRFKAASEAFLARHLGGRVEPAK